MKKAALVQGLLIFGSYINLFVLMFVVQWIQALYQTQSDANITIANGIGGSLAAYLGCFYGISLGYFGYSYFQIFKRAGQLERHNITLKDTSSIKKFEGIGIVGKPKLVRYSKLNVEMCFKDRELVKLYEKLKERIKIKYPKDIQELTQTNKTDQSGQLQYDMDFDEIDFKAYNLDYLIYKEMRSFFDDQEIDFFEKNNVKTGTTSQFEKMTISEIEDLEFKYILNFKKRRDLKDIQIALIDSLDIFSKEEINFLQSHGISNMQQLLDYDLERLTSDYNLQFSKSSPVLKSISRFFDEMKKVQRDYIDKIKMVPTSHIDYLKTSEGITHLLDSHISVADLISKYSQDTDQLKQDIAKSLSNADIVKTEIALVAAISKLTADETRFLDNKGYATPRTIIREDIETVFKNVSAIIPSIIKAAASFSDIIDKLKKDKNQLDFKSVVDILKEKITESERQNLFTISKDARFKQMYLKLVNMKALNYDYKGYLVEFDKAIPIEVGRQDYSLYTKYDNMTEQLVTEEENIAEDNAYVSKALVILPTYWEKSFEYQPDYLFDFEGMSVPCPKVTDVEYIYRNMLDSETAVLFCNSCSYIREHAKTQLTIDVSTIDAIEKAALLELVNDLTAQQEILHKRITQLKSRVEKNKQNYDRMINDWVEDIDTSEIVKKWWKIEKKPMNLYTMIMFVVCISIAFIFGILLMYAIDSIRVQAMLFEHGLSDLNTIATSVTMKMLEMISP